MRGVELRVGGFRVIAARAPSGTRGACAVRVVPDAGAEVAGELRWERAAGGELRLELATANATEATLWCARGERGDAGEALWGLRALAGPEAGREWAGVAVGALAGTATAAGAGKRRLRVKAQMPGKILKVLVATGDLVERGQALIVMEAMKMENEIRAEGAGRVGKLSAAVGAAVETGAELLIIEPEA